MFNKSFCSFFRNLNLVPFVNLSFYQIIFLFVINNFNKFLSNLHDQIDEILWNFHYKIIKLNLKFVYESILLESLIFIDVSIENWFWIFLTEKFFHFVRSYDNRVWHIKGMLLIKLQIIETNLHHRL